MKVRGLLRLSMRPAGRPVDGTSTPVVASLRMGDLWCIVSHEETPFRISSIRYNGQKGWQVIARGVTNRSSFIGIDPETERFWYLRPATRRRRR